MRSVAFDMLVEFGTGTLGLFEQNSRNALIMLLLLTYRSPDNYGSSRIDLSMK